MLGRTASVPQTAIFPHRSTVGKSAWRDREADVAGARWEGVAGVAV